MMVWAGCLTCRHDPMHKWIGHWVDEGEFDSLTPYDVHPPGNVPDIDDHVLYDYTLTDFGVPPEQSEEDLRWQAAYAESLQDADQLAPMAVLAAAKGVAIWDVDYQAFRARFAGQYEGKVTRALRKRYVVTRAGEGWYYLWRKA